VAVFALLSSWAILRSLEKNERSYPLMFLTCMLGFGTWYFIQMLQNTWGNELDTQYRFGHSEWLKYYMLIQAVAAIVVFINATQNARLITPNLPALGLTVQLAACGYTVALLCSELGSHARTKVQQENAMELGAYVFFVTTVAAMIALFTCFGILLNQRRSVKTMARLATSPNTVTTKEL